jgi:hypothetical protein
VPRRSCVSPYDGIYPSQRYADFEAEEHILATDTEATPLLWLALFRPADLRTQFIPTGLDGAGESVALTAPLVHRRRGLSQLYAAVPAIEPILGGPMSEHAELLREALRWLPGAYLTVEWWVDDLPAGHPDPVALTNALATMDQPGQPAPQQADLTRLSSLRPDGPLPSARLILDGLTATDNDRWNFRRLLGSSHMRMVPWETPI